MGTNNSLWRNLTRRIIYGVIFGSFILLIATGIASAGPPDTVQQLIAEPATLFDLGIVRLENFLRNNQPGTLHVSYDWERNKIQIKVVRINRMSRGEKNRSAEDLRRFVQHDITKIRNDLNVNPATGETDPGYTTLENCFRHAGYPNKDGQTNLKNELYDMTEISAKVIVHRNEAFVEAWAPLKGNSIEWVKFN
jgi:hypothetical protein